MKMKQEKTLNQLVKQGVNKFMKAPVKNSIGKKWMKRARLLKNKVLSNG